MDKILTSSSDDKSVPDLRTANKLRRRDRIMEEAKSLIATYGYDQFTIARIADNAGVTIPTVHNLVGKREDILTRIVDEMIIRVRHALHRPEANDPADAAEIFIDDLLALFATDEALYKAAFIAGERLHIFDHDLPDGIFRTALKLAFDLCRKAKVDGYLEGNVDPETLAWQIFGCQRLSRQDWMNGYIDLAEYRNRVLAGIYMCYAADANPAYRQQLQDRMKRSNP